MTRRTMRARLSRLWLLIRAPGRYSAARYAESSAMHLSAVRPETWREDTGGEGAEAGTGTVAEDRAAE
ncbi:MAG: hypothetical protein H6739_03960 [Alphaproteobacteria bacterium]|nr:hypothetical protein [Alphaproteobacteria bacterium]